MKGATGRLVFQRFPQVGSVGDMSVETVLTYIELGQEYML